jgi:hypothetical protein
MTLCNVGERVFTRRSDNDTTSDKTGAGWRRGADRVDIVPFGIERRGSPCVVQATACCEHWVALDSML